MRKETAILIFTRNPDQESRSKKIGSGQDKAVFRQLLAHTVQTVAAAGLPYFVITQQQGRNFGERFTHAIEEIFAKGFKNIITVGNDTPTLEPQLLREAANWLDRERMVLGPSSDGGVYLFGLTRSQFKKQDLLDLPWQSGGLLSALETMFQNAHSLDQILEDIDDFRALRNFLKAGAYAAMKLIKRLLALLARFTFKTYYVCREGVETFRYSTGLRAPPVLA